MNALKANHATRTLFARTLLEATHALVWPALLEMVSLVMVSFSFVKISLKIVYGKQSQMSVAEVNYCSDSMKDYFTDERVDRRNI